MSNELETRIREAFGDHANAIFVVIKVIAADTGQSMDRIASAILAKGQQEIDLAKMVISAAARPNKEQN